MNNIDIDKFIESTSLLAAQLVEKALNDFPIHLFEKMLQNTPTPPHHRNMALSITQRVTRSILDHVEQSDRSADYIRQIFIDRAPQFSGAWVWGAVENNPTLTAQYEAMQQDINDVLIVSPTHTPQSLKQFEELFSAVFTHRPENRRSAMNIIERTNCLFDESADSKILFNFMLDVDRHLMNDMYEEFKIKINNNLHLKHMRPTFKASEFVDTVQETISQNICSQLGVYSHAYNGDLFVYQEKCHKKWVEGLTSSLFTMDFIKAQNEAIASIMNSYYQNDKKPIPVGVQKNELVEKMFGTSLLSKYQTIITSQASHQASNGVGHKI